MNPRSDGKRLESSPDVQMAPSTLTRRTFLAASMMAVAGCGISQIDPKDVLVFGKRGLRDGEFLHPRAIGVQGGRVYVIDKAGRLQRFTEDGEFIDGWRMPETENGTPTDVAFDGERILVPDTHYHRILEFDEAGTLARQWGGRDRFIYPTGITTGPDGLVYVSEYGDNAERIQVFERSGDWVRSWGQAGQAMGEFNRAMAIVALPPDRICVADMGNHRVQVFDLEGAPLAEWGTQPDRPLAFPFDLTDTPDGSVITIDYGAHRLSRFTSDGQLAATFGSPGRTPGLFNAPRGVVAAGPWIFVADTENHRIQRIPSRALA